MYGLNCTDMILSPGETNDLKDELLACLPLSPCQPAQQTYKETGAIQPIYPLLNNAIAGGVVESLPVSFQCRRFSACLFQFFAITCERFHQP